MKVKAMVSFDSNYPVSIGGMGGFFCEGMRWKDYLEAHYKEMYPYAEAIREYVVANNIRGSGSWHQNSGEGTFLFEDDTIGSFSMRAWGDIMAAIWSEQENTDYHYMDFYM